MRLGAAAYLHDALHKTIFLSGYKTVALDAIPSGAVIPNDSESQNTTIKHKYRRP